MIAPPVSTTPEKEKRNKKMDSKYLLQLKKIMTAIPLPPSVS
jgi:hypothetical protein